MVSGTEIAEVFQGKETSFLVQNLAPGTDYSFRVSAKNRAGVRASMV